MRDTTVRIHVIADPKRPAGYAASLHVPGEATVYHRAIDLDDVRRWFREVSRAAHRGGYTVALDDESGDLD